MPTEAIYRDTPSMEPLMPEKGREILAELTAEILLQAGKLSGSLIPAKTMQGISQVVRQMNSYYSNLIEGHKTNPLDVERALKKHFSKDPKKKAMQQLGMAHIEVERLIAEKLQQEPSCNVYGAEFAQWIHREFYTRLPPELRIVHDTKDRVYPLNPGELRQYNVDVGAHVPPDYPGVPKFLSRFDEFYSSNRIIATRRLVALAASHHRFLWIHPFGDGNGRVARLLSHAHIIQTKVDGFGLWTLSRGLARSQKEYYASLTTADAPRYNDYDGRGNLSDAGLADFCTFFLKIVLDQITFMSSVLDYRGLKHRIENYIYRSNVFGKHCEQGKYLLFEALREGEYARGEAARLTGFGETVARELLQTALDQELLLSDGPRSPVYLGFPHKVCEDYFPKLFMPSA